MAEWFESWFDSKYYHILYQNRDENEANLFLSALKDHLNLPANSKILDLACGKGRHAKILSEMGYQVDGADLSENSIASALSMSNDALRFFVHDMRNPLPDNHSYDAILNLFTSFGYFDNTADNLKVLHAVYQALKPHGILVIDYLNAEKIKLNLVCAESKQCNGIDFSISRKVENDSIYKNISFSDQGNSFNYTEKVQLIGLEDFKKMLIASNFELSEVFGDYNLGKFASEKSDRLILIARKK
ncbi:MAG: class I SAM-dependent methyltransferase [Crocinitomicaceae bacterium]|nr:class I SAM-dependent methyltransferase [Crocinitomicaceae bacterium]